MKRLALVFMVLALAVPAFAQTFTAVLSGANELGGGDPDGFGVAVIQIEGTTVNYTLVVNNIAAPTLAHIHPGVAGTNGSPLVNLMPSFMGESAAGSVTTTQAIVDSIVADPAAFYVNVHNAPFPNGAIRGQLELVPAAEHQLIAFLNGANEVGGGDPDGSGLALVQIEGTTVTYTILTSNIATPTAAHIHEAQAGVSGDIRVNLMPSFTDGIASGSVTTTPALAEAILTNPIDFYVNVHNAEFPNGAIRGQLIGANDAIYFPVVGSTAGVNNTRFVTDLRIVNNEPFPVSVTIVLYAASNGGVRSAVATETVVLQPREQGVYDDVVADLLGFTSDISGGMALFADGDITAFVRVINDQRAVDGGTTGISIRGKHIDDAETSGVLPLLSQASIPDRQAGIGFRTNVGFFNPSVEPVEITFNAISSNGTLLGTRTVAVGSFQQQQLGVFGLIDTVAESNRVVEDFYVTWTSSAPVFVYATTVDNTTGDSVYVE